MSKPQLVVPSEQFQESDIMGKTMDYSFLRDLEKINLGEKNVAKPAKLKIKEYKQITDEYGITPGLYVDMHRKRNEIFRKNRKWPVFNVTGKALEETASEIIKLMAARRLTPPNTLENLPPSEIKLPI